MPKLLVNLTDAQVQFLVDRADPFSGKSGVVRDLIDSARLGVDKPLTLVERREELPEQGRASLSEASTSSSIEENTSIEVKKTKTRAKPKDPFSGRQIPDNGIPDDLLDCQQLLEEFWAGKKGSRSTSIFNRICNKLRTWPPEMRREALERAINSGWGDVYEPAISKAKKDDFDWNQLTGLSI
jgi:hypothetical protein